MLDHFLWYGYYPAGLGSLDGNEGDVILEPHAVGNTIINADGKPCEIDDDIASDAKVAAEWFTSNALPSASVPRKRARNKS